MKHDLESEDKIPGRACCGVYGCDLESLATRGLSSKRVACIQLSHLYHLHNDSLMLHMTIQLTNEYLITPLVESLAYNNC